MLVVAAHPDDETIGAGALIARSPGAVVVHVTDGAPRDPRFRSGDIRRAAYAQMRREEVCGRAMLDRFPSQSAVLAAFAVEMERVRWAPRYDFMQAPHAGPLHYERAGMPLSGERFRSLAGEALRALGLEGEPI